VFASEASLAQWELHGEVMSGKSADEPTWRTTGRCDGGHCVQIGTLGRSIVIRSSTDQDGTYITLSRDEWEEFVAGVKDGNFDRL
jgi:hypothetical protein